MVLRHGFQEEVFRFVFGSGRKVIIGRTPSDNEKALKFNRHMGFEEIARIPDAYEEGIDCVITQLRKDNCKWLR
jgi:ribosomal protein S18 acetylase RimI-like enzyme